VRERSERPSPALVFASVAALIALGALIVVFLFGPSATLEFIGLPF